MDRQDHLAWCKKRALEYVGNGELANALTSMCSDLGKHEELKKHPGIELGMGMFMCGHLKNDFEMRKFIEGFN